MSPAAKAKSARSPRTGKAKSKAPEPEPEVVEEEPAEEAESEEEQETAAAKARREKEEAAAQARAEAIDAGDLIVTKEYEFTFSDKVTQSAEVMRAIIERYQESEEPLVFNEVATTAGAKYPEDLVIAMYALEDFDLVRKFTAKAIGTDGAGRSRVAFLWTGEEVEE